MSKKVFHPLLFAIFPVLSLYVNNLAQVRGEDVLRTFVMVPLGALIFWLLVNLLIKNWNKSALVVSVFLILFFSFGHVQRSMDFLLNGGGVAFAFKEGQNNQVAYLGINIFLLILAIVLAKKTTSDLSKLTAFLNVFSLGVIFIIGINWLYLFMNTPHDAIRSYVDAWQKGQLAGVQVIQGDRISHASGEAELPDIYYIILDGYGRSDILASMYSFDNSDFLEGLRNRGFYVAEDSTPNYNFTWLSLSSSLNFMYLDGVADQIGTQTRFTLPLEVMIEDNRLFQVLRSHGYKIITFASEDRIVNITSADSYIGFDESGFNAFQNELFNTTPLSSILSLLSLKDQYDLHRERVLYTLSHLSNARKELKAPVFVFAHVLAPHPPFVFGADGQEVEPDYPFSWADGSSFMSLASRASYISGYREQAAFISKRIQQTIDEILSESAAPPIIVIQGDHGPGSMFDFASVDNSTLTERMSILNAYYFPDRNYSILYSGITPVNSFRVILNDYLGTDFELLADRNYFVTLDRPYNFIDVTDKLDGN